MGGGHEAREIVEDVNAPVAHHRKQQILQWMIFLPAHAPQRSKVLNLDRHAPVGTEGVELGGKGGCLGIEPVL